MTLNVSDLLELIDELTSSEPCWYDHHGYCQAHSLQDAPCPHTRAKELLREFGEVRD